MKTLSEIGKELNLSIEQIRVIRDHGLYHLRHSLKVKAILKEYGFTFSNRCWDNTIYGIESMYESAYPSKDIKRSRKKTLSEIEGDYDL